MPELRNGRIVVDLDDRAPRVLRLTRLPDGATLVGSDARTPFRMELNERSIGPDAMTCAIEASAGAVDYRVQVGALGLTLRFRFTLDGQDLVLALPEVVEAGAFRLETLFLPDFALVTGQASNGDHFLRHVARRHNWAQTWTPGTGTYAQWEEMGTVAGGTPERGWMASHHACVWNPRICAGVSVSIHVEPLMTRVMRDPTAPGALAGRATHFQIGPGVYPYRLRGEVAEPFEVRVGVLGDYNGNGVIDWADAAAWEQDRLPPTLPLYRDAIVYKIFCDLEREERPRATFADCLEIIKRVHAVSGGMKQFAYLVGWQYAGHDSGYPSFDQVNPRLGSLEAMRQLIEDARAYNAVVSVHINIDDSYIASPGYREDLISRDSDGTLFPWTTSNAERSPRTILSINHTLDAEAGYTRRRLEDLLALLPIRESIHCDAHRPYNEVWFANGTHIGAECEVQRGMIPILRQARELGIDISTEDTDSEKRGIYSWVWIQPNWQHPYATALQHGYLLGKHRSGARRGANAVPIELAALGTERIAGEDNDNSLEAITAHFHLYWLYSRLLARKRMLSMTVGEWGFGVSAEYADETRVHGEPFPDRMEAFYEGIPIAKDGDRFLPWDAHTIYAYSTSGGPQRCLLPHTWRGANIAAAVAFTVDGDTIAWQTTAGTPVVFRRM